MSRPPRQVHVLKSTDFGDVDATSTPLPYRIDLLTRTGARLTWDDRRQRLGATRARVDAAVAKVEARTTPFLQSVLGWRSMRRADAVVAVFESEGHFYAMARGVLPPLRRRPFVIVSCWLAELSEHAGPARLRLYRRLYRHVDAVTVFSSNQVATLGERLGIPAERIVVVPFGIDTEELDTVETSEGGTVVAVGRDLGRDWATLAAAARGTGWSVELATRARQLAGIDLPPEVHVVGYLDRPSYLDLLAAASVVVIPTEVRAYPTGQTVLLEAMALGKPCVVSDTPAMREYVDDGETGVLVPVGDAAALREAVDSLLADAGRRATLGAAARDAVAERFTATAMWAAIAPYLSPGHRGPQR